MAATTLALITGPLPAADLIQGLNSIIQSINSNVGQFTMANPAVGVTNLGNTAGTTSAFGASSVFLAGGNNITLSQSVGTNGQIATISIIANTEAPMGVSTGGNTAGTSGVISGQYVFVGTNNVNLSQSVNGQSATLSIDMKPATHFYYPDDALTAISVQANSSQSFRYLPVKYNLSATRLDILASIAADTGADLSTRAFGVTQLYGLYTNNAGTLSSLSSNSTVQTLSYTSNGTSSVVGFIRLTAGFTANMTPGDYYLLYNLFTLGSNSSGAGTTATSCMTMTMYGGNRIGTDNNFHLPTVVSATSLGAITQGIATAASAAVPATFNLNGLGITGTAVPRADIAVEFFG